MVISNQEDFDLIDMNYYYGYWPDSTKPITELKDIRKYFKKGFSHICLTSTKALFLNSYFGNEEIIKIAKINKKILPVIVLPHGLEELYHINKDVKIFRSISISNLEDHPWLEYISEKKGTIIVPYYINLKIKFYNIANKYKNINFILTEVNYPQINEVIWLLNRSKNVYIEISNFQLCNGIEYLCNVVGAGKIIFGTSSPIYACESTLLKYNKADIDYKSKKLIGRENIERLIGGQLI
jgi:hypothetical protein